MRITRSVVGIITLVTLILTPLVSATWSPSRALAQSDPPARVGRLNYMSGRVSFAPEGINKWAPAVLNYPLATGTALWTDDNARAEFHVGSTAIRMNQTTEVDILDLDNQTTQVRVPQGTVDIGLHRLAAGEQFEIDTPPAAITPAHPGHYRVVVDAAGQSAQVTVWSGQVAVATSSQSFVVGAGQTVIISGSGGSAYQIVPAGRSDAFAQWCQTREQQEAGVLQVTTQFVPAAMTGFEDLGYYGNWRTVGGYGHVWFPTVQRGWAPYRFGRWVYVSPWGWTWVDSAPWGFAPFHYGRWALIGGLWAWVPGPVTIQPVFAPALVVFMLLPNGGIGWFPLAPREAYVPPYYASPTYVRKININVVNVNVVSVPTLTNVTHVYRHSAEAITIVKNETFLRSDPVGRSLVAVVQPQIANARVQASAPVRPTLPSMLGHSGRTAAHEPPIAVQQRPVVVREAPPASAAPPVSEQQAPVRRVPVKPAVVSRGAPALRRDRPEAPVMPRPVPTPRQIRPAHPNAPHPNPVPIPRPTRPPVPISRHGSPRPLPPAPRPRPTPRRQLASPRPHPKPLQTPNCDPHSRNYDPARCPNPTPRRR
jgi:hypothetical protein